MVMCELFGATSSEGAGALFLVGGGHAACGSPWAGDQTCATAATQVAAVITPDP